MDRASKAEFTEDKYAYPPTRKLDFECEPDADGPQILVEWAFMHLLNGEAMKDALVELGSPEGGDCYIYINL